MGGFIREVIDEEIFAVLKMEGVCEYGEDVVKGFKKGYIKD
ncbi:hypothetical protein [Bacillus subtilis]|nr:hypothetical protein [Bacillus subtilis]